MFSKRKLTPLQRRKLSLIAHNERLRGECGEMWSAVGHRVEAVEDQFVWLRWVQPLLSAASMVSLVYLQRKGSPARGNGWLSPVLSLAGQAMKVKKAEG